MDLVFEQALRDLGYTQIWLNAGILTRENVLEQQVELSDPRSDKNTEHYRWQVMASYLRKCTSIIDSDIELILTIAESEPDQGMADAIRHELLGKAFLSDNQFDRVAASSSSPRLKKYAHRLSFMRSFGDTPSDDQLKAAIDTQDRFIHRWLVDNFDLPADILIRLTESGANKAVRNLAKVKLSQRIHR